MALNIAKSSGFHEPFNIKKIKRSLYKSGASKQLIEEISEKIQKIPKIKSTKEISQFILKYLQKRDPVTAARYNLKYALMELGPAGYSFEKYIAELFRYQGYETKVNPVITGQCTDHEIDFFAKKNKNIIIGECKFHNRRGSKSDVKVALYIKARCDDIYNKYKKNKTEQNLMALIVTNTRFTSKTIAYGECAGVKMLDWSYPTKEPLPDLISKLSLYPITTLPQLNIKQKREFIQNGFVLCKQATEHTKLLEQQGFTSHQIKTIIEQSHALCAYKKSAN